MKNKIISGIASIAILVAAITPIGLTSCESSGGIAGAITSAEAWWNDPANQAAIQKYVQYAETIAGFILPLLGSGNQATVSQKVQARFVEEHPDIVIPAGALKKIADAGTRRAIAKKKAGDSGP